MRWVTATQLETWARVISARNELPKVVSDLIRASSPDIASMRFPSGDKGQVRGFDGHLVSEVGAFNVPQGRSFWEFGTTPDYKEKAEGDFNKRTKELSPSDQQETTFIFVSPWTWDSSDPKNKIEDWIAARKAASSWKDVRYIDGVQLETWLEHCPAVAAWHARTTFHLQPAEGIRSTDEFWADFAGQFGPPITEEVLLCERDQAAQQLIQDLLRPSSSVSLIADSPNEVVAFAIAAIRKALPETRLYLEARTLVVDSVAAGRLLTGENLVLLLRNDAARSPGQFSSRGSILVPLGRQQRGAGTAILPRPTGYAMGTALRTMNIEENRSLTLARGSGRSLAALARLIPSGSYEQPAWVAKGQDLIPAILAGAWDGSNEPDREIVKQIAAGVSCSDVETRLRAFLLDGDPPFDLEGTVWKVRAPMDAFVRVGPLIGPQQAKPLHAAMLEVFSAIEPEPDPNDVVGLARLNPTGYSDWLREGLATTLLLFAVWSEPAVINLGGETGQAFANRVLGELPGLKSDYRLLTSLRNELPLLAEAAPDPLLSALELMLEGNGELIRPIFQERAGWIFPSSDHTGLLWALETLAWDPAYFRRAVLVLARLAAIDPGGRLSNRPGNSLAEIFVLWNPNTNALPAQRLATLDEIARICPGVGWALIVALLPATHGTSTPTAKPKLREAGAAGRPPVTYKELWESQAAVCQRAIMLAGHDPDRWVQLITPIIRFAPAERTQAIAALDSTLAPLTEDDRKRLWTKLRDEVARQERFKDAAWALPEEELAPLRALADKYAPTDPVANIGALFDRSDYADGSERARAAERRSAAIKDLYAEGGAEAILRLAAEIRAPYWIAEAAAGAGLTATEIAALLTLALDRDADTAFVVALSSIYRNLAGPKYAEQWIRETANRLSPDVTAKLFLGWPDGLGTWRAIRHFGGGVIQAYWRQRSPHYLQGSRRELLEALLMFLRNGRAVEAIQSSLDRLAEVPTELAFRMLDGVVPQLNAEAAVADTMTAFYVERLLEALDGRADVSDEQLARREFPLLPLLKHSGRQLRIYRLMAADPEFYHMILRNVFLGKGEEKSEVDERTAATARLSYSLLSHFSLLPGQSGTDIDAATLDRWIDEMRRLGAETDRVKITDIYVGRVLAHAPADPDGTWPHRIVRGEIERLASDDVERAIQIERFNMRGVHSRDVYQGGKEERDFAKAAYDAAQTVSAWPRTAGLLRAIGKMWEEDAARADVDAAQRLLRS